MYDTWNITSNSNNETVYDEELDYADITYSSVAQEFDSTLLNIDSLNDTEDGKPFEI